MFFKKRFCRNVRTVRYTLQFEKLVSCSAVIHVLLCFQQSLNVPSPLPEREVWTLEQHRNP